MLQSDSTIVELSPAHRPDSTVRVKPAKPKTVMQVLNQLPANATPAQQDSAVQANFKPGKRIYNMRPDTIGITPGTRIQRDQRVSDLQNYHNPYLFKKMLNYTAVENDRYGVAADPVPYTLSNDNVITALLIGCFIMAIIAINNSRRFILRQAKDFFYVQKSDRRTTNITETTSEVRFQLFLVILSCLLFSIVYFLYTLENVADTFILSSQYHLLVVYFICIVAFHLTRLALYTLINWIFFDRHSSRMWNKSQLFLAAVEGVLLLPFVMLITYFGMPARNAMMYVLAIVAIFEILSFCKCYAIFFRRKGGFLQIILYFCALEIVPLLALLGAMIELNNILKISY